MFDPIENLIIYSPAVALCGVNFVFFTALKFFTYLPLIINFCVANGTLLSFVVCIQQLCLPLQVSMATHAQGPGQRVLVSQCRGWGGILHNSLISNPLS